MTPATKVKIRALTLACKYQEEIARQTKTSRSTVHRYQREMGLCPPYRGRRKPELPEALENEVLTLLKSGRGTSWIGKHLKIGEHQARLVAKKFDFKRKIGEVGYRYNLSDSKRAKIIEEIHARQNFARDIAWKYRVAYKIVLALAHQELACPKFRSGGYVDPLSSNFPQKHHDRRSATA